LPTNYFNTMANTIRNKNKIQLLFKLKKNGIEISNFILSVLTARSPSN